MFFTKSFLILFVILFSNRVFSCAGSTSLDDVLNDPDIKRLLQKPLNPSAQLKADKNTINEKEMRQQEITDLENEVERLKTDRNATPAEVKRAKQKLSKLQEESFFDELMNRPVTLSNRDVDLDTNPTKSKETDMPSVKESIETKTETTEMNPITDDDRTEFAKLLQNPHISRNSKNPYDNFLEDFKYASKDVPVRAEQRDILTGQYRDVDIIGHVRSSDSGDIVLARYRSADGQVVTREVPMSSLRVNDNSGTHLLGDREILKDSNRFSTLDTNGRAQFVVDEMSRSAMTSADVESYKKLQAKLDGRKLTIDEMTNVIAKQDDLVRKYSPLRTHERETLEYNLDGLLNGDELRLTSGEERAIGQIKEIVEVRDGNPRALEDRALFERAKGINVESILDTRIKKRRTIVNQEIKALTGSEKGIEIPFKQARTWTSSQISSDIGGTAGRMRFKEAVDAIKTGFEVNNKSILDTQDARNITNAIRTLRSELKIKNALESPSADYLDYLELRVEHFNLNYRLNQ